TLDARSNGQTPEVRIYLSGSQEYRAELDPFFRGLRDHLKAPGNGLNEPPQEKGGCPYLVYEDFGTTGLEGDPSQWRKENQKNHFFNFFRAEGHSDKGETDRGRWGVGKTVFPRSSRGNTFWALTVRASDKKRLLMGRAILKSHKVTNQDYLPDGYFGIRGDRGLINPVDDQSFLDEFCQLFSLRRVKEPGLSVVVPWYSTEELTLDAVLRAVVRGYFWPIITGQLNVEIEEPGHSVRLESNTVEAIVQHNKDLQMSLGSVLKLARWANSSGKNAIRELKKPVEKGALKWSSELLSDRFAEEMRNMLQAGEMIAVRVPMPVREKKKPVMWSFFDVFLVRDGSEDRGRPVFVREGIIIPDVRGRTTRGIRSLVVVEDRPLATMLGDAENPSHTQWQKECSNYKDKYSFGPSNIEFVSNAVAEIVRLVTETQKEADPAVLIDLFSLPARPKTPDAVKAKEKKAEQKEGKGPSDEDEKDLSEPKPQPFEVERIPRGFKITSGDKGAPQPAMLDVRVAYDVRRGDPLKKYHEADFNLKDTRIEIADRDGIDVVSLEPNRMLLEVLKPDFRLCVTGFDENRDLYVKVLVREEKSDADQSA
ncbi:MAG: hypothetical protein N2255_00965, partial [Kiritimatiellae bacterium]|nr:hypothetical protein [Kiritimatiellia bacterium]